MTWLARKRHVPPRNPFHEYSEFINELVVPGDMVIARDGQLGKVLLNVLGPERGFGGYILVIWDDFTFGRVEDFTGHEVEPAFLCATCDQYRPWSEGGDGDDCDACWSRQRALQGSSERRIT